MIMLKPAGMYRKPIVEVCRYGNLWNFDLEGYLGDEEETGEVYIKLHLFFSSERSLIGKDLGSNNVWNPGSILYNNVEYNYDVWGNIRSVFGSMASTLGQDNPICYRGYYYDAETKLYYVSSRYYSPEICRFISPDDVSLVGMSPMELTDKNLYAYCDNNK